MKKILFLCHRFPLPAEGGGKIRSLNLVKHMVASGHNVTVCSQIRSTAEAEGTEEMRALGARVEVVRVRNWLQALRMMMYVPTFLPSSFAYFYSRELDQKIKRLVRDETWNLIVVHCSSVAPYVANLRHVPKVLDFADMDSQKWLDYARHKAIPANFVYALEGRKLRRQECRLARVFDFCTTVSRGELEILRNYAPKTLSDWFPNGVDLDYFFPSLDAHDPNLIVFVGRMDYYPNQQAVTWFCRTVWPHLLSRNSELEFMIVGANPSRSIRKLGRLEGVTVTGFVRDVRPYLATAAVSVVPLMIARGMQNKVLESMAMGVPVITTKRVAYGLGLNGQSPLRIAGTTEEYVKAIRELVENPEERERVAAASRALVEEHFSWSKAMHKFDCISNQALQASTFGVAVPSATEQ